MATDAKVIRYGKATIKIQDPDGGAEVEVTCIRDSGGYLLSTEAGGAVGHKDPRRGPALVIYARKEPTP